MDLIAYYYIWVVVFVFPFVNKVCKLRDCFALAAKKLGRVHNEKCYSALFSPKLAFYVGRVLRKPLFVIENIGGNIHFKALSAVIRKPQNL